jgi:hypothetical protein
MAWSQQNNLRTWALLLWAQMISAVVV